MSLNQARSQDFAQGGGGTNQPRVGQIRVTTIYARPYVVVIPTVLDSKQDKMKTAVFLLNYCFLENLFLSSVSSSAQGGAMAPLALPPLATSLL